MSKQPLLTFLETFCVGRKNRISGAELERTVGISAIELRKQVNRLRREGIPIASDRQGYYYAETAGEVYGTIRQLRSMIHGLEAAIQGLEQSLDHFGMQGGERHR